MLSRVTVQRATGRMAQDESTGREVAELETVHTDLPFRLAGSSGSDGGTHRVAIGGVEYQEATAVGHMPADTVDLQDNDLIHVAAGEWPDTWWRVVEAVRGDQKTARRVPIVEVAAP
jgi:hypothetical protein